MIDCLCHLPDADPYACESENCTYEFPELNPVPHVREHDAKVSRQCPRCPWRSSTWHIDDGSAEAEVHEHVTKAHQGRYTDSKES